MQLNMSKLDKGNVNTLIFFLLKTNCFLDCHKLGFASSASVKSELEYLFKGSGLHELGPNLTISFLYNRRAFIQGYSITIWQVMCKPLCITSIKCQGKQCIMTLP